MISLLDAAKRGGQILLVAIYAYLVAEVCVRLVRPQPLLPRYTTAAEYGVRRHVPNARYQHVTGDGTSDYRINAQGLRADKEYALSPPQGVCRVGMFGASFFMGYEVNIEDTMASEIERLLKAKGKNAEVINFALAGFGTGEMLRTYEGLGRRFGLRVALFEWAVDDLDDNVRANLYDVHDGRVVATDRPYLPAVKLQDFLSQFAVYRLMVEKSHFYSFIREWAGKRGKVILADYRVLSAKIAKVMHRGDQAASAAPEVMNPVKLSAGIVHHAQDVVEGDGVRFFLVEIPERHDRTHFTSTLGVFHAGDLAGVTTIPLLSVFDAAKGNETRLFFENGHFHFTPLGNRVAAAEVARKLLSNGVLDGCDASSDHRQDTPSGIAMPTMRP